MSHRRVTYAALVSRVAITAAFGIAALLTSSAAASPPASADETVALPSPQDKAQVIQEYYLAVSSQRYEEAYALLTPGFYASADGLQRAYRDVGTVTVDVTDIPNSRKAYVKVTLHWRTTEMTSVYDGTIALAYDTAKRWLIAHRDLKLVQGPPIDAPQNAITLPAAVSSGVLSYTLRGANDSRIMVIHIRNKTDRAWELTVEEGLRLEPSGSSAQTMTVTKEIQVKLEPHEETTIELEVACLDIGKPPPSKADSTWTITESEPLANYITCTNDVIDAAEKDDPAHAADLGQMRPGLLQASLWSARGASESDWAMFYHKWQGLTPDAAARMARELAPLHKLFVTKCGSLA